MISENIIKEKIGVLEYGINCLRSELQRLKTEYPKPDETDKIYMKDVRRDISSHENDIRLLKWVLGEPTDAPTDNKRTSDSPDGSTQTADAASDVRNPVNGNKINRGD